MSKHTPLRVAFARPWPGTRRGLCLWLFSLSFVLIGMANYVLTYPPKPSRDSLVFAFSIAQPSVWGSIMSILGFLCVWLSYCHFGRDRYGFTILSTFCGVWGFTYLSGFLFYDAGPRALSGSVVWFLYSGILVLIAGFPNVQLGKKVRTIILEDE